MQSPRNSSYFCSLFLQSMDKYKYYIAVLTAFFLWGFFSLGLKPIADYPSLDIMFYRVFYSAAVITFINRIFRKKTVLKAKEQMATMSVKQLRTAIILTLLGAITLSANWFVFIYVVNHVSVKAGALAYLICPILTTLIAFVILKEKLSKWQWLAIAISSIGCLILSFNHLKDILYSLVVAATFALYLVSQRKNAAFDKFIILNVQLLFMVLLFLPFYPIYSSEIPTDPLFYSCLFCIVVFFTIIPLFLNLYALKGLNSSTVGIIMYINPIINFGLALFYFKEPISISQLFSYFLILLSVIVFNKNILFPKKAKAIAAISKSSPL